jgi:hypothetical protein
MSLFKSTQSKIHPEFDELSDYVHNIDSLFPNIEVIIQNRRNDIRIANVGRYRLVIKSFKGMYWPNRLAYSFFRTSKSQRSFETSLRLKTMSLDAPAPVAFVDYYRFGVLQSSYFISVYQEHEEFQQALIRYESSHDLSRRFANYAFQLHKSGVYHHDFSRGNVLCLINDNDVKFSLVDLNRIRFRKMTYFDGLKSLSKLGINEGNFEQVVNHYATLWGKPFEEAKAYIARIRNARDNSGKVRLVLKRIFFPSRVTPNGRKTKFNFLPCNCK